MTNPNKRGSESHITTFGYAHQVGKDAQEKPVWAYVETQTCAAIRHYITSHGEREVTLAEVREQFPNASNDVLIAECLNACTPLTGFEGRRLKIVRPYDDEQMTTIIAPLTPVHNDPERAYANGEAEVLNIACIVFYDMGNHGTGYGIIDPPEEDELPVSVVPSDYISDLTILPISSGIPLLGNRAQLPS